MTFLSMEQIANLKKFDCFLLNWRWSRCSSSDRLTVLTHRWAASLFAKRTSFLQYNGYWGSQNVSPTHDE